MLIKWFLIQVMIAGALLAQHGYTPADAQAGGALYRVNCSACHGPEGDSVPGVDLGHGKFKRANSDEEVAAIIRNGIPGTGMPPANLSALQATTIVYFLRSLAESTSVSTTSGGDAARGKLIFENKGNCVGCHRVRGKGSRVGPDLSEVGLLRRRADLERSIVDPNAEVLAQNRYFRVITKTGAMVTGRLLNEDTFSVQLLDSHEQLVSFRKADLREYAFFPNSPMPSYKDRLNSQELADLIAYLSSLRGF
jgi:putative heme-binding domain-containing protein